MDKRSKYAGSEKNYVSAMIVLEDEYAKAFDIICKAESRSYRKKMTLVIQSFIESYIRQQVEEKENE